jgi:hypothetical protein
MLKRKFLSFILSLFLLTIFVNADWRIVYDFDLDAFRQDYFEPVRNSDMDELADVTFTLTATGDIIYRNSGNTLWVNLAIGTTGQILIEESGLPAWSPNINIVDGIINFSSSDNSGTPVTSTGETSTWSGRFSVADDGIITLFPMTTGGRFFIICGAEWADFFVDDDGDVTLIANSANVVANASTDGNLCIGNSGTQEPLIIENKLGVLNIVIILGIHD